MTLLARSAVLEGLDVVARERGLSSAKLLRAAGIPARALGDRDLRISSDQVAALLDLTSSEAGIDDLGLRLALVRRPSVLGPLRLLMREQPTIGRAIAALAKFSWAQIEGLGLSIEDDGEIALLQLSIDPALARASREASELTLASLTTMLREFLGPGWQPEMVLFRHARPASLTRHLSCFGRVPMFGQDQTALVLISAELRQPIEGGDAGSAAMVECMLGQVGPGPTAREADRVLTLIRGALSRGDCRADRIAQRLGVDRRTLHRRLARDSTTFTALVQQARREALPPLIAAGRSKTEIAGQLGFSCLSAFSRWARELGPS